MAVSREYAQAVRDNNTLRVRIMLKDSLLVDKTFSLFNELVKYAEMNGVSVWQAQEEPLEEEKKPWTIDIMNYELTALVNNFTKEHVDYVKQIIKEIYKYELHQDTSHSQKSINPHLPKPSLTRTECDNDKYYQSILKNTTQNIRILRDNKKENGDRRWLREDIDKISHYAKLIEDACERIKWR